MSKIILVGPAFPLRGGIANFNEALCRSYNLAGHSCSIVSFSLQYPSFLFPGKTQFDSGKAPDDISVKALINSVNPLSWISTAKYIKSEKPDYVIFRFWLPFMGPAFGFIARRIKSKTKVIAITDNIIPHENRIGDRPFTNYFLNTIDAVVTMSKSVQLDLKKFNYGRPSICTPHPIYDIFGDAIDRSLAKEKLGLDPALNYILFFGFIRDYKGLALLLDAFAELSSKQNNVRLIIAGEFYGDSEKYQQKIDKLGIRDLLILHTDYIAGDVVKYYFSACDIVAQPYLSATQSGVTQIAYHFERAMLVTDVGGLAEIVPHKKVGYVTSIDKTEIANALLDFFSNDRRNEFELNVKNEKARFSWNVMIEKIETLYKSL